MLSSSSLHRPARAPLCCLRWPPAPLDAVFSDNSSLRSSIRRRQAKRYNTRNTGRFSPHQDGHTEGGSVLTREQHAGRPCLGRNYLRDGNLFAIVGATTATGGAQSTISCIDVNPSLLLPRPDPSMAVPTVVLVPVWGAGHLKSMLDAGKRLLTHGGRALSLTVLLIPPPPTEELTADLDGHVRREKASGLDIRFVRLPAVELPDFRGVEDFVSRLVQLHAPDVRAAISSLESPVAAFVIDFFCTTLLDVSRELAVPSYVYFTASAGMLALFLRLPSLHEEVTVQFDGMEGAVDLPGLPPVPPSSLPNPVMDKNSANYTWFVYHGRRFAEADGIIVNTAAELEQSVLAAIADGRCTRGVRAPTVYPIGPVISFTPAAEQPHECVRWLDTQPPASVVLLCFGSGGFLAPSQAHDIAHGLERSGHRFLWVLRGPPAPGNWMPSDANLAELLPDGFLERTKGRGLVWPTKAPQKEILGHAAVGGFVTHGGWNSVLESLWFGVPMVPWPLYAEQHLNAFTLVAYMGVAVAMNVDRKRNNFVEAAELERAVKELMGGGDEGWKAREKAMAMRAACRNAVEEGGSSDAALRRLSEEMGKVATNHG